MDIAVDQKQISSVERAQIDRQVKAELIEHLYRGCLPGTVSGVPVGIAIFVDFYNYTPFNFLLTWFVFYNLALVALTALYFIYSRYKTKFSSVTWLSSYTIVMSSCALMWAIATYLIPDQQTRQYIAFFALFLIATGYATGTIGEFFLCMITLTIIIIPFVIWCLLKGTFFHQLIASFSLLYLGFMSSVNFRSTQWFKDSLKLKLENTLVSYQANHDILTDLPNQRLLPQYIESAINAIKGTHNTFALVSFSLNRMEVINDSLGHQAGDTIIQSVAMRLNTLATQTAKSKEDLTRYTITISRKDEFNILVAPIQAEEAEEKIKILLFVLEDLFYLEHRGVKLTASLGVSIYGKDGKDVQSLLINADAAMLRAKQYGGNRLEFYREEINAETPKRLELESDLHAALDKKQFLLHYQPLVNLATGKICGMEALIRWAHPTRGFISPINFIPIAEETGLIVPIGAWVLEEACRQTLKWHQMGFTFLKVAVNLSEKQLREENIVQVVANTLKKTGFDPRFLELEITETAILDEAVVYIMKEFKKMGLSLAVDDFGTGYSGLSYLKRFSIDKLKIDQSFIKDIPANSESMTIVSAIIAMAKELNVYTLAEGVETIEHLNFLKEKGCNYIQGYYFSKPLDTHLFTELLLSHRSL